jgi:predicted ABC-type exoprotein transport system permease subunit
MNNLGLLLFMALLLVVDIVCYQTALQNWGPLSMPLLILAFVLSVIIVALGIIATSNTKNTDESFREFVSKLKVR